MSESVSPSLSTMRPQVACERIRAFAEQFGSAHLVFAQRAAFPLALTLDLLYRLWANFCHTIWGERLSLPWIETLRLLVETPPTDDTFSRMHQGKGIKLLERSNCATIQGDRAPGFCHRRLAMRHPLARPGSRLPWMSQKSMGCCQRGEEQWRNQ